MSQEEVTSDVQPEAAPINVAETVDKVLEAKSEAAPSEKKEAKPEIKPEERKPEDSKLAQKFAALSKREKAIREREKAIAAKEKSEQDAAKAKPPEEKQPEKAPLKLRMKQDPFNTLKEEFGLDLETLTQIAKNEGKLTSEMQLRLQQEELDSKYAAKLEALEKRLSEKEESEKTQKQQDAEQQAFKQFKGSIADHIKSGPAEYELLGLEDDAAQVVYDVIEAHYQATKGQVDPEQPEVGRILSIKEAADHVESHLLDEAKKYTSLSKIKGLFAPAATAEAKKPEDQPAASTKTLSNSQNGDAPPSQNKRQLTREEELAEAMKLIRFTN